MGAWPKITLAMVLLAAPACAAPPDFTGLWTNNTLTPLERPKAFKGLVISEAEAKAYEAKYRGKAPDIFDDDDVGGAESEQWETDVGLSRIRGQIRGSLIVSPADGQLPYTVQARASQRVRGRRRRINFDGPEVRTRSERCLSTAAATPPMLASGIYNDNYQFVQTPHHLAIEAEDMGATRIVRLDKDARHPPASVRYAMGDSIGHWEGETLVVETTNFLPSDIDGGAAPSDDMTVIERLTRTAPGAFHYAFWVHAPGTYIQPWSGEVEFHAQKGRIFEFACHEGNYALTGILSGARQTEARARALFARAAGSGTARPGR